MIRQGDNFRIVDAAIARDLLSARGLCMARDHQPSDQPAPGSPIAAALFDDSYRRSREEIAARKARRLGILQSDLAEYHRLRRSERFKSDEAVAIILRSRRAQA